MKNVDNIKITQQLYSKNTKNDVKKINFENKCDSFEKTTDNNKKNKPELNIAKRIKNLAKVILPSAFAIKSEQTKSDNLSQIETSQNNKSGIVIHCEVPTKTTNLINNVPPKRTYTGKIKLLTPTNGNSTFSIQTSKLDEQRTIMLEHLMNDENYGISGADLLNVLSHLSNNQCLKFNYLCKAGLSTDDAFSGMHLNDTQAERYVNLIKRAVNSCTAINAVKLDDKQYERYLYFLDRGTDPTEALDLTDLEIEQYETYRYLNDNTIISFSDAKEASKLDMETQFPKFKELIDKGVFGSVAVNASKTDDEQYSRFITLIDSKAENSGKYKNVADGILLKIATLNRETQYPKFNELCNKGVDITTAVNAVTMLNDIQYSRFESLIDKNINPFFSFSASRLNDSEFKKFESLNEKGMNADSAFELARVIKDDYSSLNLKEKAGVLNKLRQIQKYYAKEKVNTIISDLNNEIEKVENSMKHVISVTDVSKAQTIQIMKGFFSNNNPEVEKAISTADFSQYGKEGVPLKYTRTEFLSDLSAEFTKLSPKTQSEIAKKLGIDLIQDKEGNITGYNGIIDLSKLSKEGIEGDILLYATEFIKENSIETGNTELDYVLNSLIEGMPEFINIIGKQQHETHELSVDTHILSVLQNVINNPEYKNLSDIDKFCLKLATLLHDISKSEGIIDENHPEISALYARDILNKYNLPAETKNRIFELVENHHRLGEYYNGDISADEVAAMFRRTDDLSSAKILTEADLKCVSDEFYETYKISLDPSIQELISESLENINSTGEMFLTNSIIDKSKVPTVKYNGKTYHVINFNKLNEDTDLQQYGFEPNTTPGNFRILVHTVSENLITENLENVIRLGDTANEGFLCASFISLENKNTYGDNKFGVVLQTENVNIANASKANQRSGFEKGFDKFSSIITGNADESKYRNKISNEIKYRLKLTDAEYARLYGILQKFKHASQLDNISLITVNNKSFTGEQIKNAITSANDLIINPNFHNEVNVYTPQVNAIIAKVNKIKEVPQTLLDFAENNKLPIYLLGSDNNKFLKDDNSNL